MGEEEEEEEEEEGVSRDGTKGLTLLQLQRFS
jgi:hypothetical protein